MTEEQKETLGQLIDRVDNLANALQIPLPPSIHVDGLKASLPDIVEELKKSFIEISGENPWD